MQEDQEQEKEDDEKQEYVEKGEEDNGGRIQRNTKEEARKGKKLDQQQYEHGNKQLALPTAPKNALRKNNSEQEGEGEQEEANKIEIDKEETVKRTNKPKNTDKEKPSE